MFSLRAPSVLFVLNYFGDFITLGSSVMVLFGDYLFNESIAETAKSYVPFFWIVFILTLFHMYYSLPEQLKAHSKLSGWLSIILGFWCAGGATHDFANGLANGGNPLTVLFITGFIFICSGVICINYQAGEKS